MAGRKPRSDATAEQSQAWEAWTTMWHAAVQAQANRVPRAKPRPKQEAELLLYVLALRNLLLGAEALLGKGHPAVAAFKRAVPGLVDVRDMLEHYDDYVAGRGKLQTKPVAPARRVDPHWLVYFGGDGQGWSEIVVAQHRVELKSSSSAAERLMSAVSDLE